MIIENQNALQQHMPMLYEKLQAYTDVTSVKVSVRFDYAKDNSKIDILSFEGTEYVMQSRYKPKEEAKKFIKQYEGMKPDTCMLFLGLGNGYVARELMANDNVTYIFFEPSIEYFCYVLEQYDISDIISNSKIRIYVKGLNHQSLSHDMYAYVHGLNWHIFYLDALPKYQQIYPKAMQQLAKIYDDAKFHGQQDYYVDIWFANRNLHNAIKNLEYIYKGTSIEEYKGALDADVPVIVVAAGPSLEKNVEQLRAYRDKAFILCADRAAPILAKHGILPHAFVTVDADKEKALFADEQSAKAPWFAYTTSSYDGLSQMHNPEVIFCSSLYGYASELFQSVGSDLQTLVNGGSVATVAVNIALKLGSKRIVLIGQDLALTGDKIHAGEQSTILPEQSTWNIMVPGFYGDMVRTRVDFKTYIDWYGAFVANYEDVTFVNATEGGAYLAGMEHLSLRDAVDKYGKHDFSLACKWNLGEENITVERQRILDEQYKSMLRYFRNVKREVKEAITWMDRGIHILQTQGLQSKELAKVEKQMNRFQDTYNGHGAKTILDMNVAKEIQEALIDVHFTKQDMVQELTRLYQKMLTFYQGVDRTVKEAVPLLENVLERLHIQ